MAYNAIGGFPPQQLSFSRNLFALYGNAPTLDQQSLRSSFGQ